MTKRLSITVRCSLVTYYCNANIRFMLVYTKAKQNATTPVIRCSNKHTTDSNVDSSGSLGGERERTTGWGDGGWRMRYRDGDREVRI